MIRAQRRPSATSEMLVRDASPQELDSAWRQVETLARERRLRMRAKRVVEFPIAVFGLGATAPLVFTVAAVLAFELQEAPFIRQQRAGHLGKPFGLIKLKTMRTAVDSQGNLLPNEERSTAFGNLVRKLSIDELPQLLNVAMGDLSLIGPRPLWQEYVSCYRLDELARLALRPGITGLAQVSGRNSVEWKERFALDVEYCKATHLIFDDILIALRTVTQVLHFGQTSVNQSRNLISARTSQPFSPPIGYDPRRCPQEWMAPSVRHAAGHAIRRRLRCFG